MEDNTNIESETIHAEVMQPVSLAMLEQKIAQLKAMVALKDDALRKQMSLIEYQQKLLDVYEEREGARIDHLTNNRG